MDSLSRLSQLRRRIAGKELDALLISQPENRRYIAGFTGSEGYVIVSATAAVLAVDFRYVEQSKRESPGFSLVQIRGGIEDWLPGLVSDLKLQRLGFEADYLSFAAYQKLVELARRLKVQVLPAQGLCESLRAVKDTAELDSIKKAVDMAEAAMELARQLIRPGVTEREVAWQLEKYLREKGSGAMPFEIIVASGPNAALPHAHPSDRPIAEGEPVLLDLGARIDGYCSDLSRTFCPGREDGTFAKIYDLVLGAQLTAAATIKPGMTGAEADQLARGVIELAGYGDKFGHGLGHGVGLAVHEVPGVGARSTDVLEEGMVFTVEPGIYLPEWGGVRIEDVAVIRQGKVELLSGKLSPTASQPILARQ
ncbi:MAG: aminopeptidase P family protein [Chloroflexota bacterium]